MTDEKQALSIDEQQSIAEAVLRLVAQYPDFPKSITTSRIHLDDLKETEDIGIFPTSGAVVTKRYISGSFEAQFPFSIFYKCLPTNNAAVISKRDMLDDLAKWLEGMSYPALSDGRKIQSIQRTTTITLVAKDESGEAVFRCDFTLKYIKKRS